MATVSLYLDTRRARKDGTFPIKLYVNHNGRFYIKTEFSAIGQNWEGTQFSKSEPNYKAKNISLRNLMNKAEEAVYSLEREGKLKSTSDERLKHLIEQAISNKEERRNTVLALFDEFIASKTKRNTIEVYELTKSKIEQFAGDCSFGEVDKKWLINFENFMLSAGMSTNTRSIHMRNLRAVFNYAIDEEITDNYPFRKFSIKKEETRKRALTVEQLRTLRDYPCEGYQQKYRDIFMLMFYLIGINSVDLLDAKELKGGRLEYRRAKTNKLYSIKVEPEALEIIERYEGKEHLLLRKKEPQALLDVMDKCDYHKNFLHRMNDGLKRIGEVERVGRGGKKQITPLFPDISSYWARHTWATIAASLDIPKETISAALGHEIGSPITSIYIKFDQNKVDEANRKVIDYVNSNL